MAAVSVQMSPQAVSLSILVLRGLQFLLSLVSLATLGATFKNIDDSVLSRVTGSLVTTGRQFQLGSASSNFLLLATYSAMMYSLWYVVVVKMFTMARPNVLMVRAMDAVMVIFLFSGALAMAVSDYVAHCSDFGDFTIRCNNVKTSVVFAFLAMVPFGLTLALSFVRVPESDATPDQAPYAMEATPTGALSPMAAGVGPTPSHKV